jgi:uncharacterized membrane protein
MDAMLMLTAGLVLFFAPHSIAIIAPKWRERVVAHLGEPLWKGGYSLLSAAGLLLIVVGFGHARRTTPVLYVSPAWLHDVTFVLMLPVFPLLLAAYLPGRIQRAARHPMLAAVKLWATAHLLANGTLADVLLFGAFLLWAVFDRISLKHRTPPLPHRAPPSRFNDPLALVGGLLLYALTVLWLHAWIIGLPLL